MLALKTLNKATATVTAEVQTLHRKLFNLHCSGGMGYMVQLHECSFVSFIRMENKARPAVDNYRGDFLL